MGGTLDKLQGLLAAAEAAADTEAVVSWGRLSRLLNAAPPPLTEWQFAELVIRAANGESLSAADWSQLVGVQLKGLRGRAPLHAPLRESLVADLRTIVRHNTAKPEQVDGAARDRARLQRRAEAEASASVLISPAWSRGAERQDRLITRGIHGALAHGVRLLANAETDLGRSLRQCAYTECGVFFFKRAPKGGRGAPISAYCRAEHRELADRAAAAKRMEKRRREQGVQPRKFR